MQTIYKILRNLEFDDFWKTFEKECPNVNISKESYRGAWEELFLMTPHVPEGYDISPDLEIVLENAFDIEGETCINVCGWSPSERERYAIEHVPWEVLVGLPINEVCSCKYNPEIIMAHCLYEMTFCGFSNEEVKKNTKELMDTLQEFKEQIENNSIEDQNNFMTFEEFRKKVENGETFNKDEDKDDTEDEN